jgi:FdhE protein
VRPDPSARIARARDLAEQHPASAEILGFYADLTAFQQTLVGREQSIPQLLSWLRAQPVVYLADAGRTFASNTAIDWPYLVDAVLHHDEQRCADATEAELFVVEAVVQPYLERDAARHPVPTATSRECPCCGNLPVVSALRERGHGAERSLICGMCLTEWPARRIGCPACSEPGFETLAIYTADTFPGVRIDACDACQRYIKTIDLTVSATAIPVVDDLASLPLDLWARQRNYRRIRHNLVRL